MSKDLYHQIAIRKESFKRYFEFRLWIWQGDQFVDRYTVIYRLLTWLGLKNRQHLSNFSIFQFRQHLSNFSIFLLSQIRWSYKTVRWKYRYKLHGCLLYFKIKRNCIREAICVPKSWIKTFPIGYPKHNTWQ